MRKSRTVTVVLFFNNSVIICTELKSSPFKSIFIAFHRFIKNYLKLIPSEMLRY